MKKTVSILLSMVMILQSVSVFASPAVETLHLQLDESIEYDNIEDIMVNPQYEEIYGYLDADEVSEYIENAVDSLFVDIDGYSINYYTGDDYVVVEEDAGISLITFDDGGAYVNGVYVNIDTVEEDVPSITRASSTLFCDHLHTIDAVGISAGVLAGIVVGYCTTSLTISAVSGALLGTYASAKVPDHLHPVVQYKHKDYFTIVDTSLGIVDWTYYINLYYGPATNPTESSVGSWVLTQTRYS